MKLNSIINRYILREMLPVFFVSVVFFLFLFLMARMLYIVNLIMNYDLNFKAVIVIIGLTLPTFLTYIIPLSVMMAVLLTTLRLSGDNEILALKTSGLSLYHLLPPILTFCILGLVVTLVMTLFVIPKSQGMLISHTARLIASNVNVGLKAQTFNSNLSKDIVIYAGQIDPASGNMTDIFIEDKRNPEMSVTVSAPKGKLLSDSRAQMVSLLLYNGEILQTNIEDKSSNSLKFADYEMHFDLKELLSTLDNVSEKDRKEMSIRELRDTIEMTAELKNRTYYRALVQLSDRFAMPFSCLFLGILVFALGAQLHVNRKSFGLLLGFIFFLLYYVLYSMGHSLAKKGQIIPWLGSWLPNIVICVLAVYFLIEVAREKELWINKVLLRIYSYMASFGKQE